MGRRKKQSKSSKATKRSTVSKPLTSKRISEGIYYLNHEAFRAGTKK